MLISESGLPEPIRRVLIEDHGETATVEAVAAKSDDELVRSANVGRKTIRILREYSASM